MLAEVLFTCGRHYLNVAGIAVAMEGDPCREMLPEECLEPISKEELENATIGGTPARDLPIGTVRFFRGDKWTKKMLEYAADQINKKGK